MTTHIFFSHFLSLSLAASWTCWFLWSPSKYWRLGTCKQIELSNLLKNSTFIGPSFKSGIDGSWKKCSKIIELNRKINLSIEGCWVFHQTWHWWKLKNVSQIFKLAWKVNLSMDFACFANQGWKLQFCGGLAKLEEEQEHKHQVLTHWWGRQQVTAIYITTYSTQY